MVESDGITGAGSVMELEGLSSDTYDHDYDLERKGSDGSDISCNRTTSQSRHVEIHDKHRDRTAQSQMDYATVVLLYGVRHGEIWQDF